MSTVGVNSYSGSTAYAPMGAYVGRNSVSGPVRASTTTVVGVNAETGPTSGRYLTSASSDQYRGHSGFVFWPQVASGMEYRGFAGGFNMDNRVSSTMNDRGYSGCLNFAIPTTASTTENRGHSGTFTAMGGRGWAHRARYRILASFLSGSAVMRDFPILITQDALPTGFIAACRADGADIRITSDEQGAVVLPREIVRFDQSNTKAEIWFGLTLTGGVDAHFFIWFGNALASEPAVQDEGSSPWVWMKSYFAFAYHLDEDLTIGSAYNSAQPPLNTNTAGSPANAPSRVPSPIGRGQSFDGISKSLDFTQSDDFQFAAHKVAGYPIDGAAVSNVCIAFYIYIDALPGSTYPIVSFGWQSGSKTGIMVGLTSTGAIYAARGNGTAIVSSTTASTLSTGAWHRVVISGDFALSNNFVYFDGASAGGGTVILGNTAASFASSTYFGLASDNDGGTRHYTNIRLDEVRIRLATVTADWAVTEYRNFNNPATFCEWLSTDTLAVTETGTGDLAAQSGTMLGTGTHQSVGNGALESGSATLSAAGTVINYGTGALGGQHATMTSTGSHGLHGTGAVTGQAATLSAAGDVCHVGGGALAARSGAITGTIILQHVGSGTLSSGSAALTDFGAVVHRGSGSLASQSGTITGSGLHTVVAPRAESVTATDTETVLMSHNGVGGLVAGNAIALGSAGIQHVGSGSLEAQRGAVSGVGVAFKTGSGAMVASAGSLLGVGPKGHNGLGYITGQSATMSCAGSRGANGSGALVAQASYIVNTSANLGHGDLFADYATLSGSGVRGLNAVYTDSTTPADAESTHAGHNGTGALVAPPANLQGAGSRVISGTGSLVAGSGDVLGIGPGAKVGSGALVSGSSTMSGVGHLFREISGNLVAQSANMAGTGHVNYRTGGTGTLVSQSASMVGIGRYGHTGYGGLVAHPATMSGNGAVVPGINGNMTGQPAHIFGTGSIGRNGTGDQIMRAGRGTLTGTGTHKHTVELGSADIHSGSATLDGRGYIRARTVDATGRLVAGYGQIVVDPRLLSDFQNTACVFTNVTGEYVRTYIKTRMFPSTLVEVSIAPETSITLQEPGYATQHIWSLVEEGALKANRALGRLERVPDPDPLSVDV